ncbi:MAG TPA: ASCH domain-containing protein [Streptosporangiaceae bacterium]|nr:ASCH domain-containing protein [Streptosporangiaceae bacterium]
MTVYVDNWRQDAGTLWALTVHQPWAAAIMWAGKNVENRTWPTKYRGPLLIHAARKHPKWADYLIIRRISGIALGWLDTRKTPAATMDLARFWPRNTGSLGVILGVVDVVGCHLDAECWHVNDESKVAFCTPWSVRDQYHWEFANPRPFARPVPANGRQRLWKVTDPEAVAQVRTQLAA